jgi:tetratricopeptide (TPR) repeat protein/tRNA A-37 threonylcarbamoyl transferase component Bud32
MPESPNTPTEAALLDFADLVARCQQLPLPRLVEVLRKDQARRWRSGQGLAAEAYLEAFPTLAASGDDALVLIWGEVLLRLEKREAPTPAEYQARFPRHTEALAIQFELQRHLGTEPIRILPNDQAGKSAELPKVPGFEVLAELGRGGMGVVYQARQTSLERVVALKVLRAGAYADDAERSRFRAEAQAAARLQHPNIVQVHEVGEYDGRPFLVLEYLEGGSLNDRLAGAPLSPRLAAGLAEILARAVHAAHQQGIVHRDLKPANVLLAHAGVSDATTVRRPDPHGLTAETPKIADFGLAKRLDSDTGQTPSGAIVGTPSYMAPEQAAGKARTVGPAADIYSLGALLYEMLTGRPPFRGESPIETLQQVVADEPVAPRALQPKLPRDLETICLKCLQKEPEKRYASAGALAEDLRRFLDGESIRARPLGPVARLYRWGKRKPALAGLLALLVVGTAVSTWQAVRATVAERERDRQRMAAEEEAASSRAVLDFLNENVLGQASAFNQAISGAAPDPDLKVRTALDRAAAGLPGKFPNRPRVEAAVRTALGSAYLDVAAYDTARAHLDEAVRLSREALGEDHPDTLKATSSLARVCLKQGKYDDAEALFARLRDSYGRLYGAEHPETLCARAELATVAQARGDLDRAEVLYTEVLEATRRALGDEYRGTLDTSTNLALLYRTRGRFHEAERLLTTVIEANRKALGDQHPDTLHTRQNLAELYLAEGRHEKALPMLREAVEAARLTYGEEHDETCTARNNLANCYFNLGRPAEAEPLFESNLDAQRRHLGEEHPHTLGTLGNLATLYLSRGEPAKAEPLFAKTLSVLRRTAAADSPDVLRAAKGLASVYYRQRKYAEAEPLYVEALAGCRKVLGEEHPNTLMVTKSLAALYVAWGKDDKAEPLFEQQRAVLARRPGGAEDPQTASVLASLGRIRLRLKKADEAEPLLRESLHIYEKRSPESFLRFHAQSLLGECLTAQTKYADAEPLVLAGYLGMLERTKEIPAGNSSLADAGERVVRLYEAWGKPEEATKWRAKLADRPRRIQPLRSTPGNVFSPNGVTFVWQIKQGTYLGALVERELVRLKF